MHTFPSAEQVLCGCDPKLQRQVLLEVPNNLYACLRCGALSYTEARGDDGHYTGEAYIVYEAIPLPSEPVPERVSLPACIAALQNPRAA
jgi:hypothetical protein